MDLAAFRTHFANQSGVVECVPLSLPRIMIDRILSRASLNFFTAHQNNTNEQMYIFFTDEKSVGVKTMRKYVRRTATWPTHAHLRFRLLGILEEKNIQRGIIVFPGNMTPSARKVGPLACFCSVS